jgi:hypothetical protein
MTPTSSPHAPRAGTAGPASRRPARGALGQPTFSAVLDSHLLPSGGASPLWGDDFGRFVAWGREALWQEIMMATGVVAVDVHVVSGRSPFTVAVS